MRVVQRTSVEPAEPSSHPATAADDTREILEPAQQDPIEVEIPPALPSVPGSVGLARPAPTKENKSAEDLAAMILNDLSKIEGCPRRGVKVTVYGSNPWNSWLSFGGDAGPVRNKADLQNFCEIITERLKRLYNVS